MKKKSKLIGIVTKVSLVCVVMLFGVMLLACGSKKEEVTTTQIKGEAITDESQSVVGYKVDGNNLSDWNGNYKGTYSDKYEKVDVEVIVEDGYISVSKKVEDLDDKDSGGNYDEEGQAYQTVDGKAIGIEDEDGGAYELRKLGGRMFFYDISSYDRSIDKKIELFDVNKEKVATQVQKKTEIKETKAAKKKVEKKKPAKKKVTKKKSKKKSSARKAIDAYEKMMNKYIKFMKKYKKASTMDQAAMAADYAEMITLYADAAEKLNKIDKDSLSASDLAYYMEVTGRITAKLAEIE